jgi:hypothetical protein
MQLHEMRKQTEESKKSLEISAKRESFQLAAEQCQIFAEKIVPSIYETLNNIPDEPREAFLSIKVDVLAEEKKVKFVKSQAVNLSELRDRIDVSKTLNYIEGFASFFCSGVAAEKVAFNTLGRAYCAVVRQWIPITLSDALNYNMWKNTHQLFFIWQCRIDQENAQKKIDNLNKQKIELQEKLKNTEDRKIPIIGVE